MITHKHTYTHVYNIVYFISQANGVTADDQLSSTSNALEIQPPGDAPENNATASRPISADVRTQPTRKRKQDSISSFVVRPTSVTLQK